MDQLRFFLELWREHLVSFPEQIPSFSLILSPEGIPLAQSGNAIDKAQSSFLHSELVCIEKATKALGEKYLNGCVLYTSLEPCLQCAGSIIHVRLKEVVYFAQAKKSEGISSLSLHSIYSSNHFPKLRWIPNPEVAQEFSDFFSEKR